MNSPTWSNVDVPKEPRKVYEWRGLIRAPENVFGEGLAILMLERFETGPARQKKIVKN